MSDLASFAVLLIVGSNVARSPIMIMDWTSAEDHRAPEISPQELSSPDGTFHSLERSFGKRWNSNAKLSVPNFNVEIICKEKMRQSLFHRLSHFFARPQTKIFSMSENLSERLKFSFII